MSNPFPPEFFGRIDDSDDELFYSVPRLVVHIDDGAIAKVSEIYARILPQGGAIASADASAARASGGTRDESRRDGK